MRYLCGALLLVLLGCDPSSDRAIAVPGPFEIRIAAPAQMQPVYQFPLAGSKDGKFLAYLTALPSQDEILHVREWSGKEIFTKPLKGDSALPLLFTPDDQSLICWTNEGELSKFQIAN